MALQSSGQITLHNIATEFGGVAPHNLTEYYRGGAYVDELASNSGVPTSGQINIKDFYGAGNGTIVTVTEGSSSGGSGGVAGKGYAAADKTVSNNAGTSFFGGIGAYGSRSPSTLNGVTIQGIYQHQYDKAIIWQFIVVLQGTRAKSFFTSVTPQGGSLLTTASCTHNQHSSSTVYTWTGVNLSATWDGSGSRTALFAF